MMQRGRSGSFADALVPIIVLLIPLGALVAYVMNQNGFFNAPPAPAAAVPVQVAAQEQAAPPAILTLDNPTVLPQNVTAGELVPFSFTIQNSGTTGATYPYKVYVQWNSGEQDVIDENSVQLAGGASTDISESLKFETTPATAEVFIEIQKPEQTIHFTLPRTR